MVDAVAGAYAHETLAAAAASPLVARLSWTVLLAPLVAAFGILCFAIHRRRLAATLALLGLGIPCVCAISLMFQVLSGALILPVETAVWWISVPGLHVQYGVLWDQLSLLMTLVVTGVGSAIFIYSTSYMADDHAYSRYFGLLSLFAFSMLTIVLATNWIQLFIGWELVGFCSYMLIGHWYAKPSAAEAGKKAFMVNRVADFGFLLGILALWALSGSTPAERTFHFLTLQAQLPWLIKTGSVAAASLPLVGLLLFCGPVGKSAQFPLHVWLPDAMEGPTPVSALIHAATMVAAGVYLLCRAFWLFEVAPSVLTTIAWVGGLTAFLSACLALVENDLKRILAFSTLSQLGYMVMALGLGGRVAGMYHLTTHAFFKALLFLAAGSVLHGVGQLDIRTLGGLRKSMPWTATAFFLGALALCGFPGFSGYFSKEEILALARERNLALYVLGTVTAGLTAFYITRAWFVAFTGKAPPVHSHESPPGMLGPLALLSVLSVVGGFLGIPRFLGEHRAGFHWDVALISTTVVAFGLFLAWLLYWKRAISPQSVARALALPYTFVERRYYVDELYAWYVTTIQQRLIAGLCAWVERVVIIGVMVNGTASLTRTLGRSIRRLQTGVVQTYVLIFLLGVVLLLQAYIRH